MARIQIDLSKNVTSEGWSQEELQKRFQAALGNALDETTRLVMEEKIASFEKTTQKKQLDIASKTSAVVRRGVPKGVQTLEEAEDRVIGTLQKYGRDIDKINLQFEKELGALQTYLKVKGGLGEHFSALANIEAAFSQTVSDAPSNLVSGGDFILDKTEEMLGERSIARSISNALEKAQQAGLQAQEKFLEGKDQELEMTLKEGFSVLVDSLLGGSGRFSTDNREQRRLDVIRKSIEAGAEEYENRLQKILEDLVNKNPESVSPRLKQLMKLRDQGPLGRDEEQEYHQERSARLRTRGFKGVKIPSGFGKGQLSGKLTTALGKAGPIIGTTIAAIKTASDLALEMANRTSDALETMGDTQASVGSVFGSSTKAILTATIPLFAKTFSPYIEYAEQQVKWLEKIALNTEQQVGPFATTALLARITHDLTMLQEAMRRGPEVDKILAGIISSRTKLEVSQQRFADTILKEFGPYLSALNIIGAGLIENTEEMISNTVGMVDFLSEKGWLGLYMKFANQALKGLYELGKLQEQRAELEGRGMQSADDIENFFAGGITE